MIGLLLLIGQPALAQIELRATVDRNQVGVGERIHLDVEATGAQSVGSPDIGDLGGFQAQYLGPSTQVSIVNGKMSASVTHRYVLFARQEGRFQLGPFRVEHEGKKYEAPTVTVQVTARASQPQPGRGQAPAQGEEDIRLTLGELKQAPYAGERVPIVLTLYVGNARVDQLQYPQLGGEGFVLDKWAEPTQRDEVINGRRYRSVRFQSTLTPLRPGVLTISPTMDMAMLRNRRRGGDPFGGIFGDAFADREPYQVRADAVDLNVQALPEAGKPADFSGAVGQFDFLLEASPTELNAGDPITVRMEIRGQGNLEGISSPSVGADDRFRRYDAVLAKDAQDARRRVYEQVVIPKDPAATNLPAVRFSFFDPSAGAYRTIARGPVPLTVRASQLAEAPKVVLPGGENGTTRPPEKLGRDIVYIKDTPGQLRERGPGFYDRWWFLLLQLIPPLAYAGVAVAVRRSDRLNADPRLVRFRQAGREARQRLDALRQAPGGARFYDELAGAVTAYLGAKLDLPPGAIERDRVLERLGRNGATGELHQQVELLFALVERARYAPTSGVDAERDKALGLAREIVDRLDRDRSLAARLAFLAFALLAPITAFSQGQEFDPHTSFFEGNAGYKAGRYADAVAAYEAVYSAGFESAALYFNLGNAHFKAGELGQAVLSFERALLLAPRDADIRSNLAYARDEAKDAPEERALWHRLAFPLATRATTGELAGVWTIGWLLLWCTLAVRVARWRGSAVLSRVASVLALVCALCGTSLGARLAATEWVRPAVVTARGETAVRFEPTTSGTTHFAVSEGTSLDVQDVREGWLQVRRRDGRRGWVPAEAVSLVANQD